MYVCMFVCVCVCMYISPLGPWGQVGRLFTAAFIRLARASLLYSLLFTRYLPMLYICIHGRFAVSWSIYAYRASLPVRVHLWTL